MGNKNALQYLLESTQVRKGINQRTAGGATAALAAALGGHHEILATLLEAGADLALADEDGCTPLMAATFRSHKRCLEFFVETGLEDSAASLNERSPSGISPLWIAVQRGDEAVITLMKENGASLGTLPPLAAREFQPRDHTPPPAQSVPSEDRLLPTIVDRLKNPSEEAANLKAPRLKKACQEGDLDTLLHFAAEGQGLDRPDLGGKTPLRYAAENDRSEACRFLIGRGAATEARDNARMETSLHTASRCGLSKTVSTLLECGADVSSKRGGDKATPLWLAADGGHARTVEILLSDQKCDPDACSATGVRPLEAACAQNHREVAKLLIDKGKVSSQISNKHWLGLAFGNFLIRKQLPEVIAKQRAEDEREAEEARQRALEEERLQREAEQRALEEKERKEKEKGGKKKGKKGKGK